MNKVILLGRLTRDPEIRYSAGAESKAVAKFILAVNRTYKKEGEQSADFINIVAFGKNAEFAEKYFRKGQQILVEGRWQTGSYTNKEGVKIYSNECIADMVEFAESKQTETKAPADDDFMNVPNNIDDEVPFPMG